jgi:acyl carrier protein
VSHDETIAAAKAYLAEELPHRAGEIAALDPEAPLFELGILDSLSFLGVVSHLEATYAIEVPPRDFAPEQFRTLAAMARYVERARGTR